MFEAKLIKGDSFKKLIELIKEIVQEAVFDCTNNGIEMQAMDNSHVSLITFLIKKESFSIYKHNQDMSLGVHLISMSKILKCAKSNDNITIKAVQDSDNVKFIFESPNQERLSEFELKLMDLTFDNLGIPDTDYDCDIQMPSAEFNRICHQLGLISDSATITVNKHSVQFSCSGDVGKGKIVLNHNVNTNKIEDRVCINLVDTVTMSFSLKYLLMFSKAVSISNCIHLSISKEAPALMEYQINDMDGYLRFYLAPKISDE